MAVANLITISDFIGQFHLPSQNDTFTSFITQKQYDILIDLMGEEIYNNFDAGLQESPVPQIWTDLVSGKTYTDLCSDIRNYKGLAYMLVPYIYSEWLIFNQHKQATTGTLKANNENSEIVDEYTLKNVSFSAWNEFVKRYNDTFLFMYSNRSDYGEIELYFKTKLFKGIITKTNIR